MRTPTIPLLLMIVWVAMPALADVGPTPARVDAFGTVVDKFIGTERLQKRLPDTAIEVLRIDGVENIKAMLGQDLPGDTQQASRTALKNLQRLGTAEREQLQQSADALVLAWQYEVRRHPAIVFDQRYVVYGVTDLREAYVLYRKWHEAKGS